MAPWALRGSSAIGDTRVPSIAESSGGQECQGKVEGRGLGEACYRTAPATPGLLIIISPFFCSVICSSNSDCKNMPGKQTCKEQVDGGGKTCKAPSSCRAQCDDDEYCAADNTCLVRSRDECGNSEDCELLYTNKTLCMGKIKEQSCILPSEKPRGTTCTDEQLWSKSDGCLSPG